MALLYCAMILDKTRAMIFVDKFSVRAKVTVWCSTIPRSTFFCHSGVISFVVGGRLVVFVWE